MKVSKKKKELKDQEKLTNLALPLNGTSKRQDDNELPQKNPERDGK